MRYVGSAFLGLVALVALTSQASAAVVCNEWGDCWKVKERPTYPPGVNLQFYDDDWRWAIPIAPSSGGANPVTNVATGDATAFG